MGYLRLLNFRHHYSKKHKRFKSYAFRDFSDRSGISVIDLDCAERTPGGVCAHCAKFYAAIAGTPIIYWPIPAEVLRDDWDIEPDDPAERKDECHYNIKKVPDSAGRGIMEKVKIEHLMICGEAGPRPMTQADLFRLLEEHEPYLSD